MVVYGSRAEASRVRLPYMAHPRVLFRLGSNHRRFSSRLTFSIVSPSRFPHAHPNELGHIWYWGYFHPRANIFTDHPINKLFWPLGLAITPDVQYGFQVCMDSRMRSSGASRVNEPEASLGEEVRATCVGFKRRTHAHCSVNPFKSTCKWHTAVCVRSKST